MKGVSKLIRKDFIFGIVTLIIVFSVIPMNFGVGLATEISEEKHEDNEEYVFQRLDEKYFYDEYSHKLVAPSEVFATLHLEKRNYNSSKIMVSGSPIDPAWSMKCHDTHHTSRSPYGTANNSYFELWNYKFGNRVDTDPSIGNDGTVYIGGEDNDYNDYLYAINPNGTLKWRYKADDFLWNMCSSITEDGTIYFCAWDGYLHAVNPDGTRKWRFKTNDDIISDPTVGEDETVYFGTMWGTGGGGEIYAVNPDGTEKWCYKTDYHVTSDPAIGDDGAIYIGSGDGYLYAMNPNGTIKWRYKTGDWVRGPPSIAEDGTIYIGSYDDFLYALYPNGTLRWKTKIYYGSETNPSIGVDGTIYICSSDKLFAVNPDGSIKWQFNLGGSVMKSSSAICADGIIYTGIMIGNMNGGEIVAVNPDGTLRWRSRLSNRWIDSSPCIGEEGIVYIVSSNDGYSRLHAFGTGGMVESDANGPYYGFIDTPIYFLGYALYGYPPYSWHWDFGDGDTSDEQNPPHVYSSSGNYTVTLIVTDKFGDISEDSTYTWIQDGNEPPNEPSIDGPKEGKTATYYDFTFVSADPEGVPIWYFIEWREGQDTGWIGPYPSGKQIMLQYEWMETGKYTIKCKAKDPYDAESEWSEFEITIPRNKQMYFSMFNWFLKMFPFLERCHMTCFLP